MGMRLKSTKSKYSESFSIIDDYTHPETNKRSTFVVEALGSLNSLMEKISNYRQRSSCQSFERLYRRAKTTTEGRKW